ncbi:MAG: S9 family peptidase [Bacteroidales bacterium]
MKKYLPAFLMVIFLLAACTPRKTTKQEVVKFSVQLSENEKKNGILTAEILWKFGRIGDMVVSPDGSRFLYTLTSYNLDKNKGNTDIYLAETTGGEPKLVAGGDGQQYNPAWVPGTGKIGYLSTETGSGQIWEYDLESGERTRISDVEGGINNFSYAPNGTKILYTKDVKLDVTPREIYPDLPKANVIMADDLMYRHWDSWTDYSYSHVFVADYQDGAISGDKDIMEGEKWDSPLAPYFDFAEINWAPTGDRIAYTSRKLVGKDYAVSTNSDIYIYDVEEAKTTNLTEGMPGYDKYPVFSPDGSKIAWISMKTPGYEADQERLFMYDFHSDEKIYLTKGFDQDASNPVWSSDGKGIFFISGTHATYQVYHIMIDNKEIRQLTEGRHNYTSLALAGDNLVGKKMAMDMATEVFSINPGTGEESQVTFVNKPIYDNIEMGKVEERWVKTTDDKNMLVWVIYPPGFDNTKKYPALLYCQGGPQSAVSQFFSFRWNFQMMAANDYIIVAPNRRGLPTFGEEWNEQISLDYGGQNMQDYLTAIDELKKESFIDQERLGAVGASYGGFSVFYLAGHHDKRFKAFISHCGMFNFESFYGTTEEYWFPNHDLGGPYWVKNRPLSYDFSPHLYIDKWDTPILIITGANDFRIAYTESLQAFNAAQLSDIPSKLLFFPEESHFVTKPQNSVLWQREFFGWLDTYLK